MRHIKRFGDYVFTVTTPEPFDGELAPPSTIMTPTTTASSRGGHLWMRVRWCFDVCPSPSTR
jgi:hypothetical protein